MNQKPGFLPGVKVQNFGAAELEIANNLATVWFIAWAGSHRIGKSIYPYAYLKPCDLFRERFNLTREVLCLFHPYAQIDSRVKEAIDGILQKDTPRLDRMCVVLVTNAESISDDLQKNESDSDPRVVLPFKYRELKGGVAGKPSLLIFDEIQNLSFEVSTSSAWADGSQSLPFWQSIRTDRRERRHLLLPNRSRGNGRKGGCARLGMSRLL
jgi:hypothetical protein